MLGVPSLGAEHIEPLGEFHYESVKFVSEEFFASMKRGVVQPRDIVLYKDGADVGKTTMWDAGFPYERCCVNEHVFLLRAKPAVGQEFLYFWLTDSGNSVDVVNLNSNSAQPGLSQDALGSLSVVLPPEALRREFAAVSRPLLDGVFRNAKQNRELVGCARSCCPSCEWRTSPIRLCPSGSYRLMAPHKGVETDFELTTIERLETEGYEHILGAELDRSLEEVVLGDRLREIFEHRYATLPEESIDAAVARCARPVGVDTIRRNLDFHLLATKGFDVAVDRPGDPGAMSTFTRLTGSVRNPTSFSRSSAFD